MPPVETVTTMGDGVAVDNTDPEHPIVSSPQMVAVLDRLLDCGPAAVGIPSANLRQWIDVASPFKTVESGFITRVFSRAQGAADAEAGASDVAVGTQGGFDVVDGVATVGLTSSESGGYDFLHEGASTGFAVIRRETGGAIPSVMSTVLNSGFGDRGFALQFLGEMHLLVANGGGVGYPVHYAFDLATGAWHVVSWVLDPANVTFADRARVYIDGVDTGDTNTGEEDVAAGSATGSMVFGGSPGGFDARWRGGIGEILLYDAMLSDPDRVSVETYLTTKWGL